MQEQTFFIGIPEGLHARPAGLLVKTMQGFPCTVTLRKGEKTADGKKLLAVMRLAVKQGEYLEVRTEGEGEKEAMAALRNLLEDSAGR